MRMTIAQLIECLMGKNVSIPKLNTSNFNIGANSFTTNYNDATPFKDVPINEIRESLKNKGYECNGKEMLFDGRTGKQIKSLIFMGPTYYQRLRHMVQDKIHARATGGVHILTRQPREGRRGNGGLRFGIMERDATIANGAAAFLNDRLFESSDKFYCHICTTCGLFAVHNEITDKAYCRVCDNSEIRKVKIPFATKLLCQELMAMNIVPRLF